MEKLKFVIRIKASREKVWNVLWQDETYRNWTRVFDEGSHAVSDWNEGSKVVFLTGQGDGMYSLIERKIANEFMSFRHLGSIKNGMEVPFDGEMATWTNSVEAYRLVDSDGFTELTVETDIVEQFREFFNEKFPQALARVKELSEAQVQ